MSSRLHLDVFVVPYKPIVGLIPPMGAGEATWPATAVSLISGDQDAVLVDAVLTPEDAGRVVDWIRATGKNLTTIYITHGHGDHFFGLNTILDAFPNASAVTAAAVVPDARRQLSPELMGFWNAIFPGQIPEHPILPDALEGDVLDLEGQQLRIITVGSRTPTLRRSSTSRAWLPSSPAMSPTTASTSRLSRIACRALPVATTSVARSWTAGEHPVRILRSWVSPPADGSRSPRR
jgi:Metallo-beta-lactamase superfamily